MQIMEMLWEYHNSHVLWVFCKARREGRTVKFIEFYACLCVLLLVASNLTSEDCAPLGKIDLGRRCFELNSTHAAPLILMLKIAKDVKNVPIVPAAGGALACFGIICLVFCGTQ